MHTNARSLENVIFTARLSQKLKTYLENSCELILKGNLKLCKSAEFWYLLLMVKFPHYGQKMNIEKELAVFLGERLTANILKSRDFKLKKELNGFSLTLYRRMNEYN